MSDFPETVADMPQEFGSMDWTQEDWDALFALRKWLEDALGAAGAEVTDAGAGMGQADVGIAMNGKSYSVSISERAAKRTASAH